MKAFRRLVYHALPCILLLAILVSGCSAQSTPTNTTPSKSTAVPTLSQPTAAEPASITPQSGCSSIVTLKLDDWSSTDEAQQRTTKFWLIFMNCLRIKVEIVSQETSGADAKRLEDIKAGTASDLIAVATLATFLPIPRLAVWLIFHPSSKPMLSSNLKKYSSLAFGNPVITRTCHAQ